LRFTTRALITHRVKTAVSAAASSFLATAKLVGANSPIRRSSLAALSPPLTSRHDYRNAPNRADAWRSRFLLNTVVLALTINIASGFLEPSCSLTLPNLRT
jgi:hypothetical protein